MFCSNCGNKLSDNAKFCSNCGQKIIVLTDNDVANSVENVNNSESAQTVKKMQENRVEELIDKYFRNISRQEDNVMLQSLDKYRIAQYSSKQIERFTTDKPLLIFDYMGEGLNAGLIITKTQYIYIMRYDMAHTYDLKDIRCFVKDKKMLATVMYCRCFNGEVSGDVYLNGITKPDAFIDAFNNFLVELNQPEKYEEQKKKEEQAKVEKERFVQEHDVVAMLKHICEPYVCSKTYCTIGIPLPSSNGKSKTVKDKFGIDQSVDIYLIYDSSILSNCSAGFVLCEQGLIYKLKNNGGIISWDEFQRCRISASVLEVKIDDLSFTTSSKEGKMVVEILTAIQQMLKEREQE